MRRGRRVYYDWFSGFYDRFVALHSGDAGALARKFLAELAPARNGGMVLDMCTGTATLLSFLWARNGPDGRVVGLDFSHGMLKAARGKTGTLPGIYLVEADAGNLPFAAGIFDAVTCSHAFYELKGDTRLCALREVIRVLKPKGSFLMMEHEVPPNPLVRALFYLRLALIGSGRAVTFLRREREELEEHFGTVEKALAPGGRSKVMVCRN